MINKLGRNKVAALVEKGVETPGDLSGVVYIQIDSPAWEDDVIKEMRASGINVNRS